ncbi:hypothetical protein GWI33_016821 [Rhynchophorus ferrugineus]|uniref:Zinc finger protein Rlf/292/654 TPR repeats domain-containing protein n=1 Tax=Rhynchophorus ferrugineus TaxID=354439 RepID=A0A834M6S9_RHYFE|nr:hypothetical protein GWI33_016821 [Rhynchophorus ferrugineus]
MASQEEDNKLECFSNINKEQETYFVSVYKIVLELVCLIACPEMSSVNEDICYTPFKKYDAILNNKLETFENKVQSLIDVWKSISELNLGQFSIRYVIQIIDWAKLHALDIVLTGEWRHITELSKNTLLENIEKAQTNLATVNDAFSSRCQKLADVVKKPWEDPVLTKLIQQENVDIGSEEIEFFCVETAYLVSVRLKKLCESHCEDLALNLVSNFLNYKKLATTHNYNLNATETQLWFIFDINIALLFKFQKREKMLQQFEELTFPEAVGLVKRFAKKRVQISKIWRHCNKIALFCCKQFLTKMFMKYTGDLKDLVADLLKTYLNMSTSDIMLNDFIESVRHITYVADAPGLCVTCDVIHREAADKLRHFAIEMYIRALTTDMNELERLKHANEEDKVKLTTSRLSNTFTNLADLLDDHVKIARECILTAFSLEPTKERLKKIEDLARRSGFPVLDTGQEWKCRLHPPAHPSDDIAWTCPECGEWMCKPELTAHLQMNLPLQEALQESVLGISEALCDDLVVCVSNPRYQILSWQLSWSDLYRLCIMYLNDPEKTKNFVTELKFVDVDYSKFEHIKREPVDEYTGIEKGYEQYLDLNFVSDEETSSVSEDSVSHDKYLQGMGSDGSGDPYLPLLQTRSDPNTLKSLRMFRPNLKRKKEESNSPSSDKRVFSDSSALTFTNLSSASQNPQPSSSTFGASSSRVYLNANNYNCSNDGYSTTEHSGQLGSQGSNNFDTIKYQLALNSNSNIPGSAMHAKLSSQNNSVFSSNLSSGTSTEYVSNIIKSNLAYGVPKIRVNASLAAASENVIYSSLDTRQPSVLQNQCSSKNIKKFSNVTELDAILTEVANEIDLDIPKTETDSKNVIAATLPQLGGQLAKNSNRLIQVPQESPNLQKKSPQGMSLLSGITADCKTKLRNKLNSNSGLTQRKTIKHQQKSKKPANKTSETRVLKVVITKLNLDKVMNSKSHPTGNITDKIESISKTLRCTQVYPSKLEGSQSLEVVIPQQIRTDQTLQQDLTLREMPSNQKYMAPHLEEPSLGLLPFPKGHLSTQNQQMVEIALDVIPTSEQLPLNLVKKPQNLKHQGSAVVSTKTTEVISQLTLNQREIKSPGFKLNASMNLVKNQGLSSPTTNNPQQINHGNDNLCRKKISSVTKEQVNQKKIATIFTQVDSPKTITQTTMDCDKDNSHLMVQNDENLKTDIEVIDIANSSNDSSVVEVAVDLRNAAARFEEYMCFDWVTTTFMEQFNRERWSSSDSSVEKDSEDCEKVQLDSNNKSVMSVDINVNSEMVCDNTIDYNLDLNDYIAVCPELKSIDPQEHDLQVKLWVEKGVMWSDKAKDSYNTDTPLKNDIKISKSSSKENHCLDDEHIIHSPHFLRSRNPTDVDVMQIDTVGNSIENDSNKTESNLKVSPLKCVDTYSEGQITLELNLSKMDFPKTIHIKNSRDFKKHKKFNNICHKRFERKKRKKIRRELFNYIPLWYNYCRPKDCFISNLEKLSLLQLSKPLKNVTKKSKIIGNQQFLIFNDQFNEDSLDTNKENITVATKELNTSSQFSNAKNELLQQDITVIEPGTQSSMLSSNKFPRILKKYSNTHKRKHLNVPCFKIDQENNTDNMVTLKEEYSANYNKDTDQTKESKEFSNLKKLFDYNSIGPRKRQPCYENSQTIKHKFNSNPCKTLKSATRQKSLLENIPGLNDFSEVRPRSTPQVVNVVQVSSTRPSTVANQNIQTSTQVTPHIQRIGQPKLSEQKSDSLEESQSSSNSTPTSTQSPKPSTSQSPTLINILNSQVLAGPKTTMPTRQAPYINILSQQIIKQPSKSVCVLPSKSTSNIPTQAATVIKVDSEGNADSVKPLNSSLKVVTSTPQTNDSSTPTTTSGQGGTILQFICKSSSLPKFQQAFGKTVYQATNSDENVAEAPAPPVGDSSEPVAQSNVDTKKAATKSVPVNVQPIAGSNTRQLFRITGSTHEQISLVKETVIQNKMSALLAAALQGKPKITEQNGELVEEYSATRITLCRPGSVPNATRIVKPVQLQIPANVIKTPQTNMSSTTLEQLREFDMVYKQVKERSSNPAQPETSVATSQESPQQRISFTYVNQVQKYTQLSPVVVVSSYNPIQQSGSPSLSVSSQSNTGGCLTQSTTVTVPKVSVKSSKGKSIKSSTTKTTTSAVPTIPKPQQKPQEDEHTTQRIFDILAEYAEQLRNSPDLNNKPAPRRRSNPPTNPSSSSSSSSSSKKKKKKTANSTNNLVEADNEDLTMGSEDSSGGNIVQLSMTDEEQSQSASITPPDTNLEPATTNTSARPLIVTDASNQPRNVIIADSSVGEALKMPNTTLIMPGSYIMPVSVVKGSQQIAVVSGGSKILTTVPARSGQNMLLFQSFVNQNKKAGISTVKYSTIQPFSGISSQNVAGVSAQPPVVLPTNSVATVTLGQPITLKKVEDNDRTNNTELLLTISQPTDTMKVDKSPDIPQPDSSTNLSNDGLEIKTDCDNQSDTTSNDNVFNNIQKTNSVATSVIASVVKKDEGRSEIVSTIETGSIKEEQNKQVGRIESVLVNASTSNGPMLSHTNPRYRKQCEGVESTTQTAKEFNHSVNKVPITGAKIFKNNAIYYAIRTKKPLSKKLDSDMQKQAAIERELRLQKSLSEECEDLGVDEPSTSDLFPEADLLFDSNHSPSYEQTGHKVQVADVKAKTSMNLFSDDENSGPMRNDLFDYVEYHSVETDVDKVNGNNIVNESASSCGDTTLLPNCGTMSEVTLNSPISPDYSDNSHTINKYKYKYTNRKKGEKNIKPQIEAWSEVTSSEDALDVDKDETPIGIQEETVIDEALMEVEAMTEDIDIPEKDQFKCPVHGNVDRNSRRTSRRPCSCFNGSKSPSVSNIKKRINPLKSQTPIPNKKPLLTKKR